MFKFFLKKNLCDIWDNMLHLFVVNIFILACAVGALAVCYAASTLPGTEAHKMLYQLLAFFIVMGLLGALVFAEGENAAKIANFEGPKFSLYFKNILPSLKDGMLFGLFVALLFVIAFVSIPFYFSIWIPADGSQGSMVGLLLMAIVFWILLIVVVALQWFLPIRSLMHNKFSKCLKKSFILFFDNPGFSFSMFLNNVVLLLLTVITLGLIPGINGITIATTNALRLRLYKYDWIEVNPGLTKAQLKEVPWDDLLETDKATLGPRKLKSFFFPWKE